MISSYILLQNLSIFNYQSPKHVCRLFPFWPWYDATFCFALHNKFEGEEDRSSKSRREQSATGKQCDWKNNIVINWVVSNIFYFHPVPWGNDPIWRVYLWNGWFNHQLVKQSNLAKHANVMMILADCEDRASISILQACALWETLVCNLDECFRVSEYSNMSWNSIFNAGPALWCPKQL